MPQVMNLLKVRQTALHFPFAEKEKYIEPEVTNSLQSFIPMILKPSAPISLQKQLSGTECIQKKCLFQSDMLPLKIILIAQSMSSKEKPMLSCMKIRKDIIEKKVLKEEKHKIKNRMLLRTCGIFMGNDT